MIKSQAGEAVKLRECTYGGCKQPAKFEVSDQAEMEANEYACEEHISVFHHSS